jgi:hypothetical protein
MFAWLRSWFGPSPAAASIEAVEGPRFRVYAIICEKTGRKGTLYESGNRRHRWIQWRGRSRLRPFWYEDLVN